MTEIQTAPYGTWDSPITADVVVSENIVFDDVLVDPVTKYIYYLEERPEDGRCVIVDALSGNDVLQKPFSARTFVHEYGGAPAIVHNGIVYFSNDSGDPSNRDSRIYSLNLTDGSDPKPVTHENPLLRYANFAVWPKDANYLVTIQEDHNNDPDGKAPQNVVNTLCIVDTSTSRVYPIVEGADFYSTPVFNPSGDKISWQEWYLPDMPWEGGLIYVAEVTSIAEKIEVSTLVAGQRRTISATFPSWITDTKLVYITDAGNRYQNPFIFDTETGESTPVLTKQEDFAEPAWWLGLYPYAILGGGKYGAFTAFRDGGNILYITDLTAPSDSSLIEPIEPFGYTVAQHVRAATDNTFVFTGSKTSAPGGVISGTVSGSSGSYTVDFTVLKASAEPSPELDAYISTPEPLTLTAGGTTEDKYTIYAVFYHPKNPNFTGPDDQKPPCIVGVHGGPTGLESQALNWTKMFYTSRGFAWLDVNYRGSSGYGRDYIELLNGNWGIYDVADCRDAATIVATTYSYIDVKRVAIRGGSAGGYTTLSSLTFAENPEFYKTACSAFGGVADPTLLVTIMEKFETEYLNTLFGSPPDGGAWDSRSPIENISNPTTGQPNLSVPLLMLHGDADGVVPPVIARCFLNRITNQVPTGQLEFSFYAKEGHHWHLKTTITDALKREFNWYLKNLL